jgi:PST family polysaccharide transporter
MLMPLSQVSGVVGKVMFPALSSIQHDKERVKRAYLKAIAMIGFITFPMMTGAFVVSDHAIRWLLGEEWLATIPIFKVFCLVGMAQSIGTTVGWVLTSQGRSGLYMAVGVINSALCATAFAVGVRWGALGVAWSYLIITLLCEPPVWAVTGRLISLSLREILNHLAMPLASAICMAIVVWACGQILSPTFDHWMFVVIQVPTGVLVYLALAMWWSVDAGKELYHVAVEMRKIHSKS